MTTKMGSSDKRPGTAAAVAVPSCKMYAAEVFMSLFIIAAGFFGAFTGGHWGMCVYLMLQGELAGDAEEGGWHNCSI